MTLLLHLLLVHVLIMSVSALISYALWRTQRIEYMRRLTHVWLCIIAATGVQVVWQGGPLGIVLALACAYPGYFLMAELVADLGYISFRRKISHTLFGGALVCTVVAWAAGLGFVWMALPTSVMLGYPLVVTSISALRTRRVNIVVRFLALINLLAATWGQTFPFLRLDESFAPIGFTVGIILVFAFAVMAPLAIVEQQRDDFAAVASHELKAPLTPLQLVADSLADLVATDEFKSLPSSRKLWRIAMATNRQVEYLNRLANNLLSITSFQAGIFKLHLEDDIDLNSVVAEVAERIELLPGDASEQKPRIVVRSSSTSSDLRPRGRWDRLKIDLVVSNLLANALKYGEGREVSVETHQDDRNVKFIVRDQGIGIDEVSQKRLFAPYQRGANAKGYSGLGLGLFVSKRIVQLHGGSIRYESSPGRGCTFELTLPRDPTV